MELPDTVTITGQAADSLKNTSVGFASGQPSLSSRNTVAVDPEADLGVRGGSGCKAVMAYYFISPQGAVTTTTRSAFWHATIQEGDGVYFLSLLKCEINSLEDLTRTKGKGVGGRLLLRDNVA